MSLYIIISILVSLVLGIAIGLLFEKFRNAKSQNENTAQIASCNAMLTQKDADIKELKEQIQTLKSDFEQKQNSNIQKINELTAQLTQSETLQKQAESLLEQEKQQYEKLQNELKELRQKNLQQQDTINLLTAKNSATDTINKNLQEKLQTQKEDIAETRKSLTEQFQNIASQLFKQHSEDFKQQNRQQIDTLLQPFSEKINEFKQQVSTAFSNETREKASLEQQLKQLLELNQTLSKEANSLTQALRKDVKQQGNWGEMILDKVLEASGLRQGMEYEKQVVAHNDEGDTLKPDVIVYMPDNKQLIIDSKVSLVDYERACNAENETEYKTYISAHVKSLKKHVEELYQKQYQHLNGLNTPDFVMMFVPIEASFTLALQADSTLYDYALARKIVIVSPTTLLATLHSVAYIWRQEYQNRNAQEIARLAGTMYDKLVGAITDFQDVQKQLKKASDSCENTLKKLAEGNGNVLRTAQKVKELGAKTSKQLKITDEAM